ncbi:MAG: DUF1284 domain-containing protein [Elusimicrobiales bacterium]
MLKIRGHHFLCIEGFRGYGYSSDFVKNMADIISKLQKDPKVIPINFADDICAFCPHLKNGMCCNEKGGEKEVFKMDSSFFKKTGIIPKQIYRYSDIKKRIYEVFKTRKKLFGICDGCSWKKICGWYISR